MSKGFQCATCGNWHDELPLNFSFAEPYYVEELELGDRERLVSGEGDFRELPRDGDTHFFIRGRIEIPIVGTNDVFTYGVWTSLSPTNYTAAKAAYAKNREAGPFFGWLSNSFPHYPETLNLKTNVHLRTDVRAAVELEPTDHPLAVEQREGITMERVKEIISLVMHESA